MVIANETELKVEKVDRRLVDTTFGWPLSKAAITMISKQPERDFFPDPASQSRA